MSKRSRTALVTGGGSGIGAATAHTFADNGFSVAVADLDAAAAENVAGKLGTNAIGIAVDVGSDASVSGLIDTVVGRLGPLDAVSVNAGVFRDAPLTETTNETVDALLSINLRGAILTARAAIPHIRDGGALIFTSSTSGLIAHPHGAVYAATKIGLIGFARSLVPEVGPSRIRVNCVCPGAVDTPLLRRHIPSEDIDRVARANPLGRIATPDDVASAIFFLATAQHVNGIALTVDGGDSAL